MIRPTLHAPTDDISHAERSYCFAQIMQNWTLEKSRFGYYCRDGQTARFAVMGGGSRWAGVWPGAVPNTGSS